MTVVASLAPALRATRVPPMAAMREGVGLPQRSGRVRAAFAALLGAGGLAAILVGLFGGAEAGDAAALLGAGAALVFLGVALFSPQLVRPLARRRRRAVRARSGSPAGWRARTRPASPAAPRRPPRR